MSKSKLQLRVSRRHYVHEAQNHDVQCVWPLAPDNEARRKAFARPIKLAGI